MMKERNWMRLVCEDTHSSHLVRCAFTVRISEVERVVCVAAALDVTGVGPSASWVEINGLGGGNALWDTPGRDPGVGGATSTTSVEGTMAEFGLVCPPSEVTVMCFVPITMSMRGLLVFILCCKHVVMDLDWPWEHLKDARRKCRRIDSVLTLRIDSVLTPKVTKISGVRAFCVALSGYLHQ